MTDLRVLWFAARSHGAMVIGAVLLGVLTAAIVNLVAPVTYSASSTIFIATPDWNDSTAIADPNARGTVGVTYGDQFTQQRMVSYAKLGSSDLVLNAAAAKLGDGTSAAQLRDATVVRPVPETVTLSVQATDTSAAGAANQANAVTEALAEAIKTLERPDSVAASPVQPVVIRPATAAGTPTSPQIVLNLLVGAAVGALAGITYAAWRTSSEIDGAAGLAELLRSGTALGVVSLDDTDPAAVEGARLLAFRLRAALGSAHATTLLLASPRSGSEARELAEALVAAFAHNGISACLDDAAHGPGDVVLTATDGVLEQSASVVTAAEHPHTVLVCPVPAATEPECAEAEHLLRLAGTTCLGRIYVVTTESPGIERLDRTIASSVAAQRKEGVSGAS